MPLLRLLRLAERGIRWLAAATEYAGWAILVGWVALITAGVVARQLFRSPFVFQVELVRVLLVPFAFLCLAAVYLRGGHIRVDLVARRLPRGAQQWLRLCSELLTIVFAVAVGINTLPIIDRSLAVNAKLDTLPLPLVLLQVCIVLGLLLFALSVATDFCARLHRLLSRGNT